MGFSFSIAIFVKIVHNASLYVQIINFIILFFSEKRAKKKKEKKEKRARSVELFSIYRSFAVAISQ